MWKWTCPNEPKILWEHHRQEWANQSILLHLLGSEKHNLAPCNADPEAHKAEDDGKACGMPNCHIPYLKK